MKKGSVSFKKETTVPPSFAVTVTRESLFLQRRTHFASFQDGGCQKNSQKREHILKLILEVRTDSRTSARLLFISCLNYRGKTAEEEPAGYKTEVS